MLTDAGPRAPRPPTTRVRIGCDGPAVMVSVDDGSVPPAGARRLDWDWATYPRGSRARLLALALSEMIARRWREGIAAPLAVAVDAAPAPHSSRPVALLRPLELGLLGSFERSGRPETTSAGLDISLGWHARPWLLARADGRGATATFEASPGTVSARRLSVEIAALFGLTRGRLWAGGGPGLRAGWAWLRGQPRDTPPAGRAFNAAWWGPVVVAGASVQATGHLVGLLMIEAGLAARPVIGEVAAPAETVALDRLWLTAAAGAAWRF